MTAATKMRTDWEKPQPVARSVARSHVGRVRTINEDRVFDCPAARLWAVADGMGGHSGGDLAAQAVVDQLRQLAASDAPLTPNSLVDALRQANAAIHARNVKLDIDAGATVVAAIIDRGSAHVAWVGDSRAYRLRDGCLSELTSDHSLVQELVDAGLLTREAAVHHPQSNVVTRALGVAPGADVDTLVVDLAVGDRLLLCSDGLSRSLRDEDVATAESIDALADRLLGYALQRDGADNVSLVLIEIPADGQP